MTFVKLKVPEKNLLVAGVEGASRAHALEESYEALIAGDHLLEGAGRFEVSGGGVEEPWTGVVWVH
jgi:hypothetical protein